MDIRAARNIRPSIKILGLNTGHSPGQLLDPNWDNTGDTSYADVSLLDMVDTVYNRHIKHFSRLTETTFED
jgi:hypothetical protein